MPLRQDDGTLWAPNQRVRVTDRRKRLLDAELLIVAVDLSLDDGGRKVMLKLAPVEAFQPFVAPTAARPIINSCGRWFTLEAGGTTRPDYSSMPLDMSVE